MTKKVCRILILGGVCAVIAGGWYAFYPGEPSFEGKSLTYWAWNMQTKPDGAEKARTVVRHLGPTSIPLLLKWLQQEDKPSLKEKFNQIRESVLFWLMRHKWIANQEVDSTMEVNPSHGAMATWVLPELGPEDRKTVIPVLIQMLGDRNHKPDEISHAAGAAYLALSKLAPESVPALIKALSSQDELVRALAMGALGNIGPDANAAIPILKEMLKDKKPMTRIGAAWTISKLGGDPQEFVPVIIQSLPQVEWDSLDFTLEILVRYKEQAKPAIPVLISILDRTPVSTNSTNIIIRDQALAALRQIDPGAAAKFDAK